MAMCEGASGKLEVFCVRALTPDLEVDVGCTGMMTPSNMTCCLLGFAMFDGLYVESLRDCVALVCSCMVLRKSAI